MFNADDVVLVLFVFLALLAIARAHIDYVRVVETQEQLHRQLELFEEHTP